MLPFASFHFIYFYLPSLSPSFYNSKIKSSSR